MTGAIHPAIVRFKEKTRQKRELEAQVKELNAEIAAAQEQAINAMLESGVTSVKVDGATIYISSQVSASPADGDEERMCNALEMLEWGDIVKRTVNRNTLASFVKGFRDEESGEIDLPTELKEVIKVTEWHRLNIKGLK